MAVVRQEWKVCGNALINARFCKFFSGSGYSALQQLVVKSLTPISKIQVQLQEWKAAINTLLMFSYCFGEISWQFVLRYGSCISAKITSFCFLRTKFEKDSGLAAEERDE